MSLKKIREKIGEALATVDGLQEHYNYVPDVVNAPCAFPALRPTDPVSYDLTAQNAALVYHFYVEILVNKGGSLEQAQDALDAFLIPAGDTSIKAAVEAIAWGTTADCCRASNISNYGPATYGGNEFLGARLMLDIWRTS